MSQHDDPHFLLTLWKTTVASAVVLLAFWGALGGVTNALVTRVSVKEAVRLILLGAFIAAGMGSLSMALISSWMSLPSELIPVGGAAGSAAYLVGVFGSAIFEVILGRIKSGRLPNEPGGE